MFKIYNFLQRLFFVLLFFLCLLASSSLYAFDTAKKSPTHPIPFYDKEKQTPICALLVRGDDKYPPYEYLDEQGEPRGFNVDIINAVAQSMGLTVQIDLGPWSEVRRQAELGEIDALIGLFNTPERDKLFDFSIPHFIASYAIFVRNNSSITSLEDAKNSKIIVQKNDLGHDYLQENAITQNIIIKEMWDEVLVALENGEGDCAIVSRLQGTQLIKNLSLTNIKAVGPPIIQRKYSIAVPQGKSALLAELNEGLSIIKETGEYDQIYDKWFGVYTEKSLTFTGAFKYLFWVILPLIAFAIISFLWSWTLQRRVTAKTDALNKELLEHKRTENILRKRENQLQKIFDILPVGLWFADKDGVIERGNTMGLKIWGINPEVPISEYRDIKGCYLPSRDPIAPDDWALIKTVRTGVTILGELLEIESFDGKKKTILNYTTPIKDDNGIVDGAIVVNLDITERTTLESQLLQSQKMEIVGTLAGGIAHDFNNILSAILGYAEMAQEGCPENSEPFNDLNEVLEAGHRAKSLVRQILAFSHRDNAERVLLKPASIVKDTITMLRPSLPTTIEITQNIKQLSSLIFINPSQINQILMNLCTNAFHAMEKTGGKLNISLQEVFLNKKDFPHAPQIQDGVFVQLSISDTGIGISPDIKDKVFEPYFTTKEVGKGTGMGLSIIHGIVKNCSGMVSFKSKKGEGTTFHVYLPVVEREVIATEESDNEILVGTEKVLFIDDEQPITQMGKTILEKFGYQVIAKNSSTEALETFENNPNSFDVVITDQTMPEMTGCELSRKILQIRPGIPIILCTGYSTIISEKKAKAIGIKEFALKPLGKKDLAMLIRKALDAN